ncbi:hypothetical protein ABTE36_23260, partial [Acinetobacter baumannii]
GAHPRVLADIEALVRDVGRALSAWHEPVDAGQEAGEPLLAADAFSNPAYVRFALKTTLAVVICYLIYTSLDWFSVHTAL